MVLTFRDFPPHVRLMLLCARARHSNAEVADIQLLAADPQLDWPEFLAVTTHHKLGPLCFSALDRLRPAGLPSRIRDDLHDRATNNAFEALRSTHAVRELTEAFAAAGHPIAVLKGVPLSQLLFGSPHARHVGDLDLLTSAESLPAQIDLLAQASYRITNPPCRLTPARIASFVTFWKDFTFANAANGFELDLHWRLFNNRLHAANPLLVDTEFASVSTFGVPMRVLPPVDQFVYIAAHGMSDAWIYLKSLADVAGFLNLFTQPELDAALARAADLGLLSQISAAIHLANDWMGTTAASPRLLPSVGHAASRVRQRTETSLLRHHFRPHRVQTSPFQWLMLELTLVPGARSVVEILRRYVWRPRVWTSIDLPDRLFWIYPLVGLLLPPRAHTVED